MALYLLRALLEHTLTGDSRDRIVYGWHVNAPAQPSASDLIADIATAQGIVGGPGIVQAEWTWDTAQVYDVVAKGPPVDEALFGGAAVPNTGAAGPSEVQAVVTRWTNDSLGRPRKRGRRYLGPISGTHMNGNRYIPSNTRTTFLGWEQALLGAFVARGWTNVVVTGGQFLVEEPIVGLSIDNAWDTQRRRGLDPTDETIEALGGGPL